MKRKRFKEEQIIAVLKEGERSVPIKELCRKHGMSETSFYKWRQKFGGMEVNEAKRLRELEDENRRLKKLVAELALDVDMLKAVNRKKWWGMERLSGGRRLRRRPGVCDDKGTEFMVFVIWRTRGRSSWFSSFAHQPAQRPHPLARPRAGSLSRSALLPCSATRDHFCRFGFQDALLGRIADRPRCALRANVRETSTLPENSVEGEMDCEDEEAQECTGETAHGRVVALGGPACCVALDG